MTNTTPNTPPRTNVRDYDRDRMQRIGGAMFGSLLEELRSPEGVVVMPTREIMDAMALLLGVMLSSSPQAKVPSQLRELCQGFAKDIIKRTHEAQANGAAGRLFDHVLTDEDRFQ